MNAYLIRWISLIYLVPLYAFAAADSTVSVEEEMDVRYKKQVPIYLQHDLGEISIQGWNQDLIRVKLKKSVVTDSEENAKLIFKQFSLISLETPKSVELRVGTPQGTDILTKIRNQQLKKNIKIDLEIKAPSSLPISIVVGTEKKLKLTQWRGKINITGKKNIVELAKIRANFPLNINCVDCSLSVSDSEFSGSILMSDQKIEITRSAALPKPILIFSQKGMVSLDKTKGDFQVRTLSGDVYSKSHQGDLHIQSDSGKVHVEALEGDLDTQTQAGDIHVSAVKILNQLELKSRSGKIEIVLPHVFSGEVNLQSTKGDVLTDFSIQKNKQKMNDQYGPELKGKMIGQVGTDLHVNILANSESGKIHLKQKELPE